MNSASQRAFNASPFRPKAKPTTMRTMTARATSPCPLCEVRVKAGQRVALHFSSQEWAHVGCVVRLVNANRVGV